MSVFLTILQQGSEYTFIWHPQLATQVSQSTTGFLCWAKTILQPHQQNELQTAIDSAAQVAGQLRHGMNGNDLPLLRLGRLLFSHLLPNPLQELIHRLPPATPFCICSNNTELPWELLHDDKDFLALRHIVTRQMLVSSNEVSPLTQPRASLNCLLIGNPNGNLDAADAEVENLIDLFQSAPQPMQVEFLCREHASKVRVMAALASGAYDLIHFACHARPGAVRLADAWLDAEEIQRVLRGRPVIVLNACSSGRIESENQNGITFAGQQVHNLAQAFLTGGASAFLGTAWSVSDSEIRWLALEFYRGLLSGHTLGSALRNARIRTRSRDANVTSWSAPVLYSGPLHRLPQPTLQRQPGTILTVRMYTKDTVVAEESLEAYAQRVQQLANYLVTIAKNYGGQVITLRPDYLRVLFGIPNPVEDDAVRAIRAGLEIRAFAEKQTEGSAIAITSGEIAITSLSPQFSQGGGNEIDATLPPLYLGEIFGEADVLALQSQRNQVLANPRSRQLADGHFAFASLMTEDDQTLMPCYEATALIDGENTLLREDSASLRWPAQILGRERELGILSSYWQSAIQTRGHVVGIVGEAGVGKSRLLAEYRRTVSTTEHRWIGLSCPSTGRDTPYMLVGQLLHKIFGILLSDNAEEVEAKIAHRLGELSGVSIATDPQTNQILRETLGLSTSDLPVDERKARRGRLVHLLRTLMANAAQQKPLLISIDDIQWIDEVSLEILGQVTDGIYRLPVQFVVVYRPEWRHSWFDKAYYHHLPLDQLDQVASVELLCRLLQSQQLPKGLSVLLQKTGGNPFFIEEMVKSLQDTGVLIQRVAPEQSTQIVWELQRPLAEHHLPGTVERALRVRLESLTPITREVLEAAAVIGPAFSLPLLENLLEALAEQVQTALTELEQRGFIEARWDIQEYYFRHALILDTVYQNMPVGQQQSWHRRIAEALEAGEVPQLIEVEALAHHYYHSVLLSRPMEPPKLDESSNMRQVAKGVNCLVQCGQRALERYATRESINYYQRALFLHRLLTDSYESEVTIREGLGDAFNTLGDFNAAYQHFRLAYGTLHTHPLTKAERRRAAELARRLGRVCAWRGEHDEAIAWMREGLRELGELEDDEDKAAAALLHVHTGSVEYNRGNHSQVTSECERGLHLAREIERPLPAQAEADNLLGIIAWANGNCQKALDHYSQSVFTWHALGNSYQATRVEGNMGVAHFYLAQWEEAQRHHTYCKEYWERIEDQDMLAHPCLNLGNIHLCQGNWEQAEIYFRRALALWSNVHHKRFIALSHTNLGLLHIEQEEWAKAQVQLEESYEILTQSTIRDLLSEVMSALAEVALGTCDLERALTFATQARDLAIELLMRPEEALALRILGRIYLAQCDIEPARAYLQQALAILREVENPYEEARTLFRVAQVELQANRTDEARLFLDQALTRFVALGASQDRLRAEQMLRVLDISS